MGQQTHFFFALKLPTKTKETLKVFLDEAKGSYHFARWVHEQDYHITLAFLGQANADMLELAKRNIQQQLSNIEIFPLTITELGIFGNKDTPRIFWAGVQPEEQLHIVRNQVFSACKQAGFQLETRPFHPHITLARKWQGDHPFSKDLFDSQKELSHPLRFTADEVVLYQTHLDKTPKYEAIATYKLKNTAL